MYAVITAETTSLNFILMEANYKKYTIISIKNIIITSYTLVMQ